MIRKAPLAGVRILDLTRVLAGPYATQILGDMGADVLKIEHPVRGDDTRAWGPPFTDGGESAYYLTANRNKRSVALDFKASAGQEILKRLAAKSDVFVENFVPGGLDKYGLGYEDLRRINPKMVYVSITGYGQTGPMANRPGYDVMVEAEFGLMHITGNPESPPAKVGVAVTDLTTGLYSAVSILGALRHAELTGEGQHIDASLSDCQLATLANISSSVLVSGKRDAGRQGSAHPSIVPYQAFETKDGSIMIGGGNDNLFRHICDGLDRPEWKLEPRFSTNALRVENRIELVGLINEITRTRTTVQWQDAWSGKPFPFAPINDVKDSLEHPHSVAREMVSEVPHPQGSIKMVSPPVKWSATPPQITRPPPLLGEHTLEVLAELGSAGEDELAALLKEGVIAARPQEGPSVN